MKVNKKEYKEDEFLQLSGIQHFVFCRRQWALIHVENQWVENYFTVDGDLFHENVHNSSFTEKRKDIILSRGVPVQSYKLGISGECDMVEFHSSKKGVPLKNREGLWLPLPVEYKRGKPNENGADEMQLCAQAMCLEEMFVIPKIKYGYLYYGQPAKRTRVEFTDEMRVEVTIALQEMHSYMERRHTSKAKSGKKCTSCSMKDICLPKMFSSSSAKAYITKQLEEL